MSRIGKRPIEIPTGVNIVLEPGRVSVTGPLGALQQDVPQRMQIAQEESVLTVTRPTERGEDRALHGLTRTLIANQIIGVTQGYTKGLEVVGTGYRVQARGTSIEFALGFSHPVLVEPPAGITFTVEGNNRLTVSGNDKQAVGETAANIRKIRKPEPYKGKGVRYAGENVRRKAGKSGK
jgi:large subunit ribosomal protein L6